MYKKYKIVDTGYMMTGTMGTGESFPFTYEVIFTVQDGFVQYAEMNKYLSHQDIERYFQMTIDEYFEHEMIVYRNNQNDFDFRSLEPINSDGYIISREITDFKDLSLFKRKWIYDKAVDDTGIKVVFEKYIREYYDNIKYEMIEKRD